MSFWTTNNLSPLTYANSVVSLSTGVRGAAAGEKYEKK